MAWTAVASLTSFHVAPAQAVRIMPLGDSITAARAPQSSYRFYLWHGLKLADYCVDMVGSQQGVFQTPPPRPHFDHDHEGHAGQRTDEILEQLPEWVAVARPDIVLIHLGTNDLIQGRTPPQIVLDLERIIAVLRAARLDVTILLAQIIPHGSGDVVPLNLAIARLAEQQHQANAPVFLVDQFTDFDVAADTFDGVHPNDSGEVKIAERFFAILHNLNLPEGACWNTYGTGFPTGVDTPTLTLEALPTCNSVLRMRFEHTLGTATAAFLYLGTEQAVLPVDGAALYLHPLRIWPLVIPANGLTAYDTIPDLLCDQTFFAQIRVADARALSLWAYSPGVQIDVRR